MRIVRPDNGANISGTSQVIEAAVGHSVVRVDFYRHINASFATGAKAVMDPPVLIRTVTDGPPWRVNWQLPSGCPVSVSLLVIGFDACGGGNDSPIITVTTCRQ